MGISWDKTGVLGKKSGWWFQLKKVSKSVGMMTFPIYGNSYGNS
jgi:hypothetical protein